MKKLISILVAFAMMATLAVTMAFAEGENPTITITKKLNLAQGLTAPENFTFTTEAVSYNGDTTGADFAAMPNLGTATVAMQGLTDTDADGYIQLNTTLATAANYTKPGLYIYKISEVEGSDPNTTYDDNSYTVKLTVNKDGDVTNMVVVNDETDDKVDPSTPDPKEEGEQDDNASGVLFENLFKKTVDPTVTAATITKTVAGDYGDTAKQFPFTMTIDTSATNYDAADINITVVKGSTTITPAEGVYSFTLANGESVEIKGAPVGTTYTVTEDLGNDEASKLYYAGTVVTEKGAVVDKGHEADATAPGADITVTDALVADGVNSVAYTNNIDDEDVTPTGILMSNLPYIALALVAIGGLVAYVVVRRRNADEA